MAQWTEGRWPDAAFFDVMNCSVLRCSHGPSQIVLDLENGLSLKLVDDSETYECMRIAIGDDVWIV